MKKVQKAQDTFKSAHPDELKFVELHRQTDHKLDFMRRYLGQWPSIMAQAGKNGRVNASKLFVNDCFAGAGGHMSVISPRGQVPGTALEACQHARNVQNKFSGTRVSVRLIDIDENVCMRLGVRVADFHDGATGSSCVDVRIIRADFASQIEPILFEALKPDGSHYHTLWWIDPYGVKIIPRSSLAALLWVDNAEIIINLDVRGIKRMRDAVYSNLGFSATRETTHRTLDSIYGGASWDVGVERTSMIPDSDQCKELASNYAASFGDRFLAKEVYELRSSDAQTRYLVHLSNSRVARSAFAKTFQATQLSKSKTRALSPAVRDQWTKVFHDHFKGQSVSFDEMFGLPQSRLNGAQLNTVLRHASVTGFGQYDGKIKKMCWNQESTKPVALELRFDDHIEKKRARQVDTIRFQTSLFEEFPPIG